MLRIAVRFASYDKAKSIGVVIGIVVSTFLVGQQIGIFYFLTGAMSALVDNARADLWVVDNRTTDANALGLIDVRVGRQVASLPGVARVYPLVVTGATARFPGGKSAGLTLIGAQPPALRGGPWNVVAGSTEALLEDGAVSLDVFDRSVLSDAQKGTRFEINGRQAFVALETRGARGFGATYMFTTDERARAFGAIPIEKASAFLVDVAGGVDPRAIRDLINSTVAGVRAWTAADFSDATVRTILSTSGIAFSVGTLIVFAFVAGMIIIGLTMYSAAVDRLRDYGTLKAIGANNAYIRGLIITQALLFALAGFAIGISLVEAFRSGIANTGVIFTYGPRTKVGFFLMTLVISLGGATFAMRRIAKVEPASVFKG
jgi:putative ABC transport system permease protein